MHILVAHLSARFSADRLNDAQSRKRSRLSNADTCLYMLENRGSWPHGAEVKDQNVTHVHACSSQSKVSSRHFAADKTRMCCCIWRRWDERLLLIGRSFCPAASRRYLCNQIQLFRCRNNGGCLFVELNPPHLGSAFIRQVSTAITKHVLANSSAELLQTECY